jgi:MoxR-like ATPase
MDSATALTVYRRLRERLSRHVLGRTDDVADLPTLDLILVALFTGGHVLLEDYPGSGKSFLAEHLGRAIDFDLPPDAATGAHPYRRIQCTPDLLPTDLIGYLDARQVFHPGPVFSTVLLVDEVNRTTPKVQSALLEAMAERQVSVENRSHRLNELFFVIATQNPLDHVGTHDLPAAQLDRFLFKRVLPPIRPEQEALVITLDDPREHRRQRDRTGQPLPDGPETPPVPASAILAVRAWCLAEVTCHPDLVPCLLEVSDRLVARFGPDRVYRTSPRSHKLLFNALKVLALALAASAPGRPQPLTVHPSLLGRIARDFYVHRLGLPAPELRAAAAEAERVVAETLESRKLARR